MIAKRAWAVAACFLVLPLTALGAESHLVPSPLESMRVLVKLEDDGSLTYRAWRGDRVALEPSPLGFVLQDGRELTRFRILSVRESQTLERWTLPWGEFREGEAHWKELELSLESSDVRMNLVFRVFEDGLAYRFLWPEQPNLDAFTIMDERSGFDFPGDPRVWWIPAYAGNRYEYLYEGTRCSALRARDVRAVHTPLTVESENGLYLAIHEADLTDYAAMTLAPGPGARFDCDLVPWSDGARVKARTPFATPWRTVHVVERPQDLIASPMILALNPPSRIPDTSWIEPGKYAGIWWSLHIGKESWKTGPTHGATTENTRRMIDFAAEHGLGGVLVEGWNTGWDLGWLNEGVFDYTTPTPDYDLEGLAAYAREEGVTLIGHLETGGDVHGFERRLEIVFSLFERLGIRAVKTGYVNHGQNIRRYDETGNLVAREWQHGQYMVRHFRKVVEAAARHRIMVNVHEPIKDTGIRRTWPNMMTREGARGQEYNAWSEGNPPDHTTILPFTRLLGGPMDFTPGIVNISIKPYRDKNRVHTTVAKQLALYVTIYSPLQMVTDLPEHYAGHPAFGFIRSVPADWEETRVLNGAIGDYVTIVRRERGGDRWFLGSVTDEQARTLEAPLDFLAPGVEYTAYVYADAANAHYAGNPTRMHISRKRVNRDTVLEIALAPGGGQAVRFEPVR